MQEAITSVYNNSLLYSSHCSFPSSFNLFTPFVPQWFHCTHLTLSRDYTSYFPQWSCITSASFLVIVSEGTLSHLRSDLMKTFFFFFASPRSHSKGPSRWIDLQVQEQHAGWIQLNEVPKRCLHTIQADLYAWQGVISHQKEWVATVRLQIPVQ